MTPRNKCGSKNRGLGLDYIWPSLQSMLLEISKSKFPFFLNFKAPGVPVGRRSNNDVSVSIIKSGNFSGLQPFQILGKIMC